MTFQVGKPPVILCAQGAGVSVSWGYPTMAGILYARDRGKVRYPGVSIGALRERVPFTHPNYGSSGIPYPP